MKSFDCIFIYYDPYYDFKVAYNEGKTIQYQMVRNIDWRDIETENELLNCIEENRILRVKPEEKQMWYAHTCGNSFVIDNIEADVAYFSENLDKVESWCCKQSYCKACAYYDDKNDKTSCKTLGYQPVEAGSYSCRTFSPKEKSRRVTNKELAKWLAKGKGQMKVFSNKEGIVFSLFNYDVDLDNKMVNERISVRRWIDDDWHEPTAEYLGIKD